MQAMLILSQAFLHLGAIYSGQKSILACSTPSTHARVGMQLDSPRGLPVPVGMRHRIAPHEKMPCRLAPAFNARVMVRSDRTPPMRVHSPHPIPHLPSQASRIFPQLNTKLPFVVLLQALMLLSHV